MTVTNFILFSDQPTQPFIDALAMVNITFRGWEIPSYRFSKRKSLRNFLKTERGWIDSRDTTSGDLKLTVDGDHHAAWKTVIEIGQVHDVDVNIGGCIINE
jgi:hypothetical protein